MPEYELIERRREQHIRPGRILACLGLTGLLAGAAWGQPFPNKPVRIVAGEPGGSGDLVARLLAPGLAVNLGQQVVIDNRGGAGGVIAAQTLIKAPTDGHTMLLYGNGIWLLPFMRDNVPYDPVRDFAPVTLAASMPNLLVVHPSLPVRSVKELVALAKARPGELNYGSGSTGAAPHLGAELFKSMAGVNLVIVNYKGTGATLTGLIAGQVQLMFPPTNSAAPHIKSGRLRALAVTTAQPSALVPELPTIANSGLPGYECVTVLGVFAASKTQSLIVSRLNQDIVRALTTSEVKERLTRVGAEAIGSSPQESAVAMKADMNLWGKVIKDAGIRDE